MTEADTVRTLEVARVFMCAVARERASGLIAKPASARALAESKPSLLACMEAMTASSILGLWQPMTARASWKASVILNADVCALSYDAPTSMVPAVLKVCVSVPTVYVPSKEKGVQESSPNERRAS